MSAGISKGAVHAIVVDELKVRKICSLCILSANCENNPLWVWRFGSKKAGRNCGWWRDLDTVWRTTIRREECTGKGDSFLGRISETWKSYTQYFLFTWPSYPDFSLEMKDNYRSLYAQLPLRGRKILLGAKAKVWSRIVELEHPPYCFFAKLEKDLAGRHFDTSFDLRNVVWDP